MAIWGIGIYDKVERSKCFFVCSFKLMESVSVMSISPFKIAYYFFSTCVFRFLKIPGILLNFSLLGFSLGQVLFFSSCLLVSKLSPRYFLKVSIKGMKVSRFTPEAYKSSGATLRHRSHELIVMKEIQEGAPLSYKVVITPANPIEPYLTMVVNGYN